MTTSNNPYAPPPSVPPKEIMLRADRLLFAANILILGAAATDQLLWNIGWYLGSVEIREAVARLTGVEEVSKELFYLLLFCGIEPWLFASWYSFLRRLHFDRKSGIGSAMTELWIPIRNFRAPYRFFRSIPTLPSTIVAFWQVNYALFFVSVPLVFVVAGIFPKSLATEVFARIADALYISPGYSSIVLLFHTYPRAN